MAELPDRIMTSSAYQTSPMDSGNVADNDLIDQLQH